MNRRTFFATAASFAASVWFGVAHPIKAVKKWVLRYEDKIEVEAGGKVIGVCEVKVLEATNHEDSQKCYVGLGNDPGRWTCYQIQNGIVIKRTDGDAPPEVV